MNQNATHTEWHLSVFHAPDGDLLVEVPLIGADVPTLLRILGGNSEEDLRYVTPITSVAQLEKLRTFADFPVDTRAYKYYVEEVRVVRGEHSG